MRPAIYRLLTAQRNFHETRFADILVVARPYRDGAPLVRRLGGVWCSRTDPVVLRGTSRPICRLSPNKCRGDLHPPATAARFSQPETTRTNHPATHERALIPCRDLNTRRSFVFRQSRAPTEIPPLFVMNDVGFEDARTTQLVRMPGTSSQCGGCAGRPWPVTVMRARMCAQI